MNGDRSACDSSSPSPMSNEVTERKNKVSTVNLNQPSNDPVDCCSSIPSTLQVNDNHCKQKSIATSTTTLNNLNICKPQSSPQCISSSCVCRCCTPQESDEGANSTSSDSTQDDPFDNERINVMREIVNKCITVDIDRRPSAEEIYDRLSKLIWSDNLLL